MTLLAPLVAGDRAPRQAGEGIAVQSLVLVPLAALPLDPVEGQMARLVADGLVYQYVGGSWNLFLPPGPPSGYVVGLPIATTVLDSVDPSLYGTVKWAVEIRKGTRRLVFEIVASHDGVTASEMRPVSMQLGTGLFDITVAVALVPGAPTGSLEIAVTPASLGWSISWQRIYTLP